MKTRLLSILVAGLDDREWTKIIRLLRRQANAFPGEVEVLASVDSGKITSGVKRQQLVDQALGDYIAFVDDDDEVSAHYVRRILEGCRTGCDVVTFDLERMVGKRNRRGERQVFRTQVRDREVHAGRLLMTANHLCAWRRDIATRVAWDPLLGYGDDQMWYLPLVASLGRNIWEHHIDEVLYRYQYEPSGTANQTHPRVQFTKRLYAGGVECWKVFGEVLIATAGIDVIGPDGLVSVRDKNNRVRVMHRDELADTMCVVEIR